MLAQSQRNGLGAGRFDDACRPGAPFLLPPHMATDIVVHSDHVTGIAALPAARFGAQLEPARGAATPFDFGPPPRGHFDSPGVLALFDRRWAEAECGSPDGLPPAEALCLQRLGELSRLRGASRSGRGASPRRCHRSQDLRA